MKTETITQTLLRRLDASVGKHYRIAMEAGISQAAISRYYRRKGSPKLASADKLLAWYAADDKRNGKASASLPNTVTLKRARPTAAAAVAQQSK